MAEYIVVIVFGIIILYLVLFAIIDFIFDALDEFEVWEIYIIPIALLIRGFIGLYVLLRELFQISLKQIKKNSKTMNLRILGKAMGFMFLPTLGVLLLLLVGFFDPIMLWTWIKSNSGWAIFTRIVIFLLETGLVIIMYFIYLEEYTKKQILDDAANAPKDRSNSAAYHTELKQLFGTSNGSFKYYKTKVSNLILVERIPE